MGTKEKSFGVKDLTAFMDECARHGNPVTSGSKRRLTALVGGHRLSVQQHELLGIFDNSGDVSAFIQWYDQRHAL